MTLKIIDGREHFLQFCTKVLSYFLLSSYDVDISKSCPKVFWNSLEGLIVLNTPYYIPSLLSTLLSTYISKDRKTEDKRNKKVTF